MRHPHVSKLGLLLALLLAACDALELPTPPAPAPGAPPTEFARDVVGLVNEARAAGHDCGEEGVFAAAPPVALEPRLTGAAQAHADDMHDHGYFSHTGRDGSRIGERVDRTGYRWSRVGENIGQGYPDAASVTADWLGSDGHCANLMDPDFVHLGVGRSGGYWVQVFGRPK